VEIVTPGITALEYAYRRASLAALLPENSVAILGAATKKYRSGPVFYRFHQDSNFFYLTGTVSLCLLLEAEWLGFNEPDALAVIDKRSSTPVFHMLVRERNEDSELWDGPRSGTQAAMDVFNADEVATV
jgi:intermediate cleaving peptidase 55